MPRDSHRGAVSTSPLAAISQFASLWAGSDTERILPVAAWRSTSLAAETDVRDFEDSTLWRVSAYERMRAQTGDSGFARLSGESTLPQTLAAELSQLQRAQASGDALEVVAACIRHRDSALLLVRHRELVWPLTLFPRDNLYHLPRSIIESLEQGARDLKVMSVEPPGLRPPGHVMHERIAASPGYRPLPLLLWTLALHAPRETLLDDIAGRAAYRLVSDFSPETGALSGALGPALKRLRGEIASLADMAGWPGMSRERAARLLNGVYLQGGLMVLRTHNAARHGAGGSERLRQWWRAVR